MRPLPLLIAAIVLAAALPAAAQSDTTAADAATVRACLADAELKGVAADIHCDSLFSGPCLDDPANLSTAGMVACIGLDFRAWDAVLNEDYQRLLAQLDAEQAEALRDAERKWLAFRDADCLFPHLLVRGTLAQPWGASCMVRHTIDRVITIRGFLAYLGA
jgi:uncharacterized protein YecT (DUF1311 family)